MKIVLITPITPYKENLRGTSGIQYHLLIERNKKENAECFNKVSLDEIDVIIYTFNNNRLNKQQIEEVEKELNVKIKVIKQSKCIDIILKLHLLIVRVFLRYPIFYYMKLKQVYVDEIKSMNPDGIWVYGQDQSRISQQFKKYKRIHTLPDSEALYYYRMLGRRFVFTNWKTYIRQVIMYPKYIRMENEYPYDKNISYHVVGEEDAEFLRNNNTSIQVFFIRHPHYEVSSFKHISLFYEQRIKILIAGRNDLYMHQSAEELVQCLISNSSLIKDDYIFTFLGKGWEEHVKTLRMAGYEINHITFAPDYIEEICKHDIQITPITIGTGTKGKVLDALANGLLVIGTQYALENIAVKNGVSCIEYNNPQEVINILNDIPNNRHKYEMMAEEGRKCVLTYHNRAKVSHELFSLFCE
ncbi:MAG: glycosyltransferase family 4 protein [Bacteroidaceae bacterium]|nr:glycosyltransferase family 4 protein [Bacteroidaceae bacterium]